MKKATAKKKISRDLISAKQIADKYNLTYQTVNHYTDFSLLPVCAKKGNVRYYEKDIIARRLPLIRALAEEGYSLRLIRKRLVGI